MNDPELQGAELNRRRWRGTLEISLTDEKTGKVISRSICQDEVWDSPRYMDPSLKGLSELFRQAVEEHASQGGIYD